LIIRFFDNIRKKHTIQLYHSIIYNIRVTMSSGVIDDGNIRKELMTRRSIIDTAVKLKDVLGRDVSKSEIRGLMSFMGKQNFNTFRGSNPDVARELLAIKFSEQITQQQSGGYFIDVKELLKRSIGRIDVSDGPDSSEGTVFNKSVCQSDVGIPSTNTLQIKSDDRDNPSVQRQHGYEKFDTSISNGGKSANHDVVDAIGNLKNEFRMLKTIQDVYSAYILLDSRYRKIEGAIGNPINDYKWEYTPTIYTEQGTTNVVSRIQDVLYMQVQPFHIPVVPAAENVYGKVSMLIEEFSALAVIGHENRRFHYLFDADRDGNRILLNPPGLDDGKFRFSTPINRVDQLTVNFGAPLTPITFEPDRFNVTIVPINAVSTQIVFPQAHNVNNAEVVILSGYTTDDPIADEAAINIINQPEGHVVNVVNATTLNIVVDLTAIVAPVINPVVECYITTRRVMISLRLVYAHKPAI
jgi:hypothetical protein